MANTTAINSFLYMDLVKDKSARALLKNAMGFLFCDNTTPTPFPDASHSNTEGLTQI